MAVQNETQIPPALLRFVDDAAVFPPGNAPLDEALTHHRTHRASWYQALIGPLLLPTSKVDQLQTVWNSTDPLRIGLIGDTGIDDVAPTLASLPEHFTVNQVEARAENLNKIDSLITAAADWGVPAYAEIPIVSHLDKHLDALVGTGINPKFRTGGLSADLFPSPAELGNAISQCARRELDFKLTAGLHHATRHTDPETGFTHHGFANVLAATMLAKTGSDLADVRAILETTQPDAPADVIRESLNRDRDLWVGFGSCSVTEPLDDLIELSLIEH